MNTPHTSGLSLTRCLLVGVILLAGLALAAIALWLPTTQVARAAAPTAASRYVAPSGVDSGGCTDPANPCATVQYAIDQAQDGDAVLIAAGVYTDLNNYGGFAQVVYLSKTLTLRGGYSPDFTNWDPQQYTTTLDAGGGGRVLYVTGVSTATLDSLQITGGEAPPPNSDGGGIYINMASMVISNCHIYSNLGREGGGIYAYRFLGLIRRNTIRDNYSHRFGGGISLRGSYALIKDNLITNNISYRGGGGGISLYESPALLFANTIMSNSIPMGLYAYNSGGGGVALYSSAATLQSNIIVGNLVEPVIHDNDLGGGGVYLHRSDNAILNDNIISGNMSGSEEWNRDSIGGGIFVNDSDRVILNNNLITNNRSFNNDGGGMYLLWGEDITLTNNIIAENYTDNSGSGIYAERVSLHMSHTTIVSNSGGDGMGIYIIDPDGQYSTTMVNTILVSHTLGIYVGSSAIVNLEGTLWGNTTDWAGNGTIITGTVNLWGNPDFVDPPAGDYHIGPNSLARDAGVFSGVFSDIDGDPRPAGPAPDIGADEFPGPALPVMLRAAPSILNPGQTVTYSISVASVFTNTQVRLTDTLPALQQALAITSTHGACILDAGWGGGVSCDLGSLASGERVAITLTAWVTRELPVALPQSMRNMISVTSQETYHMAGIDTLLHDCHVRINDDPMEYTVLQEAIDASSQPGDTLRVAGYCSGVASRYGALQVGYIDKTLTLQGGWDATFTQRDPLIYPTFLDARGQGRGLYITRDISVTIEGFHINRGHARNLDVGGGIHAFRASLVLNDNRIFHNSGNFGGGISIEDGALFVTQTHIFRNTVSRGGGGGVYLNSSIAEFHSSAIYENTEAGHGGGVYAWNSDVSLWRSTITANKTTTQAGNNGGGFYLSGSNVTLVENIISGNLANQSGGGIHATNSYLILSRNIISGNQVTAYWAYGGGISLRNSEGEISENVISMNTAGDEGGGMIIQGSDSMIIRENYIISNTAYGHGPYSYGGGIALSVKNVALVNNVIADNYAATHGSGLDILLSSASPSSYQLVHNTIARNTGGDGHGIYIGGSNPGANIILVDTILISHTVGIFVTEGNTAVLEGTLWGNQTDWAGAGTIITGTINVWGDPDFIDPAQGDYHIGPGSAAIDMGVDAGVDSDIDGETRPFGLGYDIGADELVAELRLTKRADAEIANIGAPLTYTVSFTNSLYTHANMVITDVIPLELVDVSFQSSVAITPTGAISYVWLTGSLPPGAQGTITITGVLSPEISQEYVFTNTALIRGRMLGAFSVFAIDHAPVEINVPPVVYAGLDRTVAEGEIVYLSGVYTDPGALDTHDFLWDFGDGLTLTDTLTPTHTYADDGLFTVTLVVTDSDGGVGWDMLLITVTNVSPVVHAGLDHMVAEGEIIYFSGVYTDPGVLDTHDILWDFGDGFSITGTLTPAHTYADNGLFTVTLVVTDSDGGVGWDTLIVTVTNVPPAVEAGEDITLTLGEAFTRAGSFVDPGADLWSASVDYGDGSGQQPLDLTGMTFALSHTYTQAGVFTITVTVSDDDGGFGATQVTVTVLERERKVHLPIVKR